MLQNQYPLNPDLPVKAQGSPDCDQPPAAGDKPHTTHTIHLHVEMSHTQYTLLINHHAAEDQPECKSKTVVEDLDLDTPDRPVTKHGVQLEGLF